MPVLEYRLVDDHWSVAWEVVIPSVVGHRCRRSNADGAYQGERHECGHQYCYPFSLHCCSPPSLLGGGIRSRLPPLSELIEFRLGT